MNLFNLKGLIEEESQLSRENWNEPSRIQDRDLSRIDEESPQSESGLACFIYSFSINDRVLKLIFEKYLKNFRLISYFFQK